MKTTITTTTTSIDITVQPVTVEVNETLVVNSTLEIIDPILVNQTSTITINETVTSPLNVNLIITNETLNETVT